ncbi:MAG: hypothetical protein OXG56_06440 [Gammaproteobacteria bacterium]|nr:hypothetical protein [Gammaproteobacteria bacterium]
MIEKFRSLSPRLRRGLQVFFAVCALVTLLDIFVHKHHGEEHWWGFFGFFSAYGFIACVVLVVVATWMRRVVMRDEDYYD